MRDTLVALILLAGVLLAGLVGFLQIAALYVTITIGPLLVRFRALGEMFHLTQPCPSTTPTSPHPPPPKGSPSRLSSAGSVRRTWPA